MSGDVLKMFDARLKTIKDDAWGKYARLGRVPAFKDLASELEKHNLKACGSWVCAHPIKKMSQFYKNGDVLQSFCKPCNNGEGGRARVAAAKRAKQAVANVVSAADDDKQSSIDVEDVASNWLIAEMAARGIELPKNGEFRTADNGAREVESNDDSWLQVQLKANGPFKKDGTPMPNDRSDHGGVANFSQCAAYTNMLMMFVKTRIADAEGNRVYTVWAADGADVTSEQLYEHVDGTLGPNRVPPITLDALAVRIRTSTLPRVTWAHMFLDVTLGDHRKEIVLMLATRATGATVVFPVGNQTSVDCHVDGVAEQFKTFNVANGSVNAGHSVKGRPGRAYKENDGIERMREAAIVKSGDAYYLLYAYQPLHELLAHNIFAHDGYRGNPKSPGQCCISPPLGIFQSWLNGGKRKNAVPHQCKWLEKPAFGFRSPIEIKPGEYGIPIEWLDEAAQEAVNPSAFPNAAQLDALDERIEQHEENLQAGIDRRAAEDAAKEAKAAANDAKEYAERSEAASSSGAGPSYTTNNNITINNFNGTVTEPAAKRLCQPSIRGFLN